MQKIMLSGLVALSLVAGSVAQAAPTKKGIRVVSGAKVLSSAEKASVDGMHCGCAPHDTKPGYGFGTTGHYGPPGQGFDSHDSWRMHANGGDGKTPRGNELPPRAFTTPTRFQFD